MAVAPESIETGAPRSCPHSITATLDVLTVAENNSDCAHGLKDGLRTDLWDYSGSGRVCVCVCVHACTLCELAATAA